MAALIFRLRNVPDDEANDVRNLLDEHQIDWYETSAGNWGIAMPGLWVRDAADKERARALIDDYQRERGAREREAFQQRRAEGSQPRLIDQVRARPLATLAIVAFCAFIVYVTLWPFLRLIGQGAD